MDSASKILVATVTGLIITFGSLGAGADNPPASADERMRTLVHDEVERQLNDRVPAEVQRQLIEIARRAQANAYRISKLEALESRLANARSQIVLYGLQHRDAFPTLAQFNAGWTILTNPTSVDGTIGANEDYGPYLKSPLVNPFNNSSTVAPFGHATATSGWSYDEKTHRFFAVVPENFVHSLRKGDAEFVKGWLADNTN